MILGRAGGQQAARTPASAVIAGGQAAAMQSQLNFSRDMEREADRVGFGVMTAGRLRARRAWRRCSRSCSSASRLNDNGGFPYLRTHPLTTERIADMQSRQQLGGARRRCRCLTWSTP